MRHAGLLTILLLFCVSPGDRVDAAPAVINYQGKLTMPGGTPVGTTVTLTFTFYNAQTGGSQLGAGFSDADELVPDSHGVCSTLVGDIPGNPIPADVFGGDSVWLNVAVNGEDLSSRLQISSVGYAMRADSASSAAQALQVPAEGQVDGDAVRSGTVTEPRIDPAIARDSELAAAVANFYPKAAADGRYIQRSGSAYLVVVTTNSAVQNGLNLLTAYAQAKTLTPNGMGRSATNRAAVILPPAVYDLQSSQIVMDGEFVDLIGLSPARDNQFIVSDSSPVGYGFGGLLRQTANDVRIHNLIVHLKRSEYDLLHNDDDSAAYFPDSNKPATQVRNCEFRGMGPEFLTEDPYPRFSGSWSMRVSIVYSGTYTDCVASGEALSGCGESPGSGDAAFGGVLGAASGTFTNCTGGLMSFGGDGTASGRFVDCTGGRVSFGGDGTASGSFTDCRGSEESFGGGYPGLSSGTFTNCTGGLRSFGGRGIASGTFIGCTGSDYAFGGDGISSGTFTSCRGGARSFGGHGTASGTFSACSGGDFAFGGDAGNATGGRFYHCAGGVDSFTTSGSPTLLYCVRNNAPFP